MRRPCKRPDLEQAALSQLDVQPGAIVWDVGAGSGSVAIEAAQLARPGAVYAVEQDVADHHLIVANAQTFGVSNLTAVHGTTAAVRWREREARARHQSPCTRGVEQVARQPVQQPDLPQRTRRDHDPRARWARDHLLSARTGTRVLATRRRVVAPGVRCCWKPAPPDS